MDNSLISCDKKFVSNLISFDELSELTENGKRHYVTPTGEKYPSVTSVLGSGDKSWLHEWKKRVGEEEANRITLRATTRGTSLHKLCENYIGNKDGFSLNYSPLIINMFKSIQPFINYIEEIYGSEVAVYSHELKTAGRIDVFCKMGGKKIILDFKTSSKRKQEKDIKNYFLQTTAYALAIREIKGIDIPKVVILIAVENDLPQYFIKNTCDYEDEVRETFRNYHSNHRK